MMISSCTKRAAVTKSSVPKMQLGLKGCARISTDVLRPLITGQHISGLASRRGGNLNTGARGNGKQTVCAAAADNGNYDYDVFTIGAGSGGVRGSRIAASYGAKVAICELPFDYKSGERQGGVGGTCVLRGCVPKKLMVYGSEFADHFRESHGFGWSAPEAVGHDWERMREAKRNELNRLNNAYKNTLKNANVELIEGRGSIVDAHTVDVDGKNYTAKNIIIAVGGTPSKVPIPGADLTITSDDALELSRRPDKITVLGGGYIAIEFACIFHRFGADVHVAFRQQLPLRGFDEQVREFVNEQYIASGMNLHPKLSPVEVKKQPNGKLTVVLQSADGKTEEIADNDQVLMATGRHPKVAGLNLEAVGVQLGKKGEVVVDEYCRTSVPSIWALGDVIGRVALTPVALMEGMALARSVALHQPTKPDYYAIPSAVFSHPEISNVGLTEEQALEQYPNLEVYTSNFRPMKNNLSGSPLRSLMKLIVNADNRQVVGAHMVGDHAGEIMQGMSLAVKANLTKETVDSVIGVHPTSAEEFVTMRSPARVFRNRELVKA